MEYEVLGWPEEGPTLRLDYRQFSYAGKFVLSNSGKAVARADGKLVGAVAFNENSTAPETMWLRYVTVRKDRRGEGIGARLARFTTARILAADYERATVAVNNPFAYHALYKAGFGFIGEETGLAELVLATDADRSRAAYQAGLDVYRTRDLSEAEESFLAAHRGVDPPATLADPATGER